jgi:hypothetical protein
MPSSPPSGDPRRQQLLLNFILGFLIFTALLLLILPLGIPRPLRILLFFSEVFAAGAIWVLAKARLPRNRD